MSNETPEQSTLTIYDGTAMLFRSYYGMRSVTSRHGTEVGAVLGVAQRFIKMLRLHRPTQIAVVFDAGKKTFRNEIYERYKANRGDPPEDLIPQFDFVQEVSRAMGFVNYCVPGFEADDLIATLAQSARTSGHPCQIVSIDKDLCQLVDDSPPPTYIFDSKKLTPFDEAGVEERMSVHPRHVTSFQALVGDSTDNIPGVPGVGPKAAKALIDAYGDLDNIYANLSNIPSLALRGAKSLAIKLENSRDDAYLALQLVTLKKDIPLDTTPQNIAEHTRWRGPLPEADEIFDRLGFHRPLQQLRDLYERYEAT